MKTTKKTVMKKPTVKKMAAGGAAKKMVKPKPLQKANLGMAMDSSETNDSECQGWPPGKKCHGFNRKAVPRSIRKAQKRKRS